MALLSGPVTYSRFRVLGGGPKRLDDALLDKLRAHVIGKQRVARSDGTDAGWIGGRHILDRHFDVEKNVILDCLHFGLRVDASRVPPDLMRAYTEMEMEALKPRDDSGRITAAQRMEARQTAKRRAEQEIREGRFRRLRQAPILLDAERDTLYVCATQAATLDRLHLLFKETFNKRLEPVTAGSLAYAFAERAGLSRALEHLEPAALVPHPSGATGNGYHGVYWTAHDSASRDFLGNEFLLWLWFTLAEETDTIELSDQSGVAVVIVKQLVLECPWAESGRETILCDGPTRLPESRRAIQTGKLPRRAGLIISRRGEQYELVLQAETMNISGAMLPKVSENGNGNGHGHGPADARRRPAAINGNGHAVMEGRIRQIRDLAETVDLLYEAFLHRRLSSKWSTEANRIAAWLRGG